MALAIISVLSLLALPMAEVASKRSKEIELRRALRDVRTAIDALHEDWRFGRISADPRLVSADGYPRTLMVLVNGVELVGEFKRVRKYLRQIPRDPFGDGSQPPEKQWRLVSYQDHEKSILWGRRDVYDIQSQNEAVALDGSKYCGW